MNGSLQSAWNSARIRAIATVKAARRRLSQVFDGSHGDVTNGAVPSLGGPSLRTAAAVQVRPHSLLRSERLAARAARRAARRVTGGLSGNAHQRRKARRAALRAAVLI